MIEQMNELLKQWKWYKTGCNAQKYYKVSFGVPRNDDQAL
jgi:hypothetical protein